MLASSILHNCPRCLNKPQGEGSHLHTHNEIFVPQYCFVNSPFLISSHSKAPGRLLYICVAIIAFMHNHVAVDIIPTGQMNQKLNGSDSGRPVRYAIAVTTVKHLARHALDGHKPVCYPLLCRLDPSEAYLLCSARMAGACRANCIASQTTLPPEPAGNQPP